jgi:hypothetical protein
MAVGSGVIVLLLLLIVGVGIPLFELSGRRRDEAERFQRRMIEELVRSAANLPLTVVAHMPESRRSRIVVEIAGSVATEEIRQTVLDAVRREASRLGREVRVADRLEVRFPSDSPTA